MYCSHCGSEIDDEAADYKRNNFGIQFKRRTF